MRRGLLVGLGCSVLIVVFHLASRDGLWTAVAVLATSSALLRGLVRDPWAGQCLRWQAGLWSLRQGGRERVIEPTRAHVLAPVLVHIAYRDCASGVRANLVVFADSVQGDAYRRLLVRATLL